jgi:hypothetical protein
VCDAYIIMFTVLVEKCGSNRVTGAKKLPPKTLETLAAAGFQQATQKVTDYQEITNERHHPEHPPRNHAFGGQRIQDSPAR